MNGRPLTLFFLAALASILAGAFLLPSLARRGVFMPGDPTRRAAYALSIPCVHESKELIDSHLPETQPSLPQAVQPFDFEPDVVVLVTNQNDGNLEFCNCGGPMEGGLSRRASIVKAYRARWPNLVLLDTGDLSGVESDPLKDRFIREEYRLMLYDAVAVGDQDLDAWARKPASVVSELPWVSANLKLLSGGPAFASSRLIHVGKLTASVTAVSSPEAIDFLEPAAREIVTAEAYPSQVVLQAADLRILLLHRNQDEEVSPELAGHCDLVVQSYSDLQQHFEPVKVGNAWVVAAMPGGKSVGVVAIKLGHDHFERFQWREVSVDGTLWPRDAEGWRIYESYASAAMREKLASPQQKGLQYCSSYECGRCHVAEYEQWKGTAHGHAYSTLSAVKRQGDPNCLTCHTTGFGVKDGFRSIEDTPHQVGVSCLNCHRINLTEHMGHPGKLPKQTEETCRTCHTDVSSPKFNFDEYVKKVNHGH